MTNETEREQSCSNCRWRPYSWCYLWGTVRDAEQTCDCWDPMPEERGEADSVDDNQKGGGE